MTSTLHGTRGDRSRERHRSFPRSFQVSTLSPLILIWPSVESWPAKNLNPRILGQTMPEQPQNDEIRDLKCPTFSPTHPLVTRLKRSRFTIRPAAKGFDPKPQPLIHAFRSLSCLRIASSTSRPSLGTALSSDQTKEQDRIATVFIEFQTAWLIYWNAYVDLQNQLYEAIKAARDVSWLAATDTDKLSRLNNSQRELFARMPRRMDYMPLVQINRNLRSAISKLDQLEKAMSTEKEKCLRLMDAIQIIQQKIEIAKKELQNKP